MRLLKGLQMGLLLWNTCRHITWQTLIDFSNDKAEGEIKEEMKWESSNETTVDSYERHCSLTPTKNTSKARAGFSGDVCLIRTITCSFEGQILMERKTLQFMKRFPLIIYWSHPRIMCSRQLWAKSNQVRLLTHPMQWCPSLKSF